MEILEIRVNCQTNRSGAEEERWWNYSLFVRLESLWESNSPIESNQPLEDSGVLMGVNTRLLSVVVTYRASRYEQTDPFWLSIPHRDTWLACESSMRIDKTSHVDPRISHAVVIVACQSRVNDTPVTLIRSRSDKQFLQRYYFVFLQTFANEFFPDWREKKKKINKGEIEKGWSKIRESLGNEIEGNGGKCERWKKGEKEGKVFRRDFWVG